ncbi:hypothetical protein Dd1591_3877 [Dickeya chrysanthemi Ech1591]|uniref:Uncharacterized protein n=1 Tax=Dickeya chrysanthemi (strain Ech1591) TaxID=561229 RepID=C6CN84_DICC1|nr:hypothetical protein [Dickeya chrysanthemi]ACT08677.1 hypothetical protein Dd1591_3877 [Dickeya chrysanthemi Ech1591]WJM84865.1 hypothetical protein QUF31_17360 [Dickeya chrysanthemi]
MYDDDKSLCMVLDAGFDFIFDTDDQSGDLNGGLTPILYGNPEENVYL